jgi:hypothetical protein
MKNEETYTDNDTKPITLKEAAKKAGFSLNEGRIYTLENFLIKNNDNDSFFQWLIFTNNTENIPKSLMCEEIFNTQNNEKETPLHDAVHSDYIKEIPQHILTEKNLFIENKKGITPLMLMSRTEYQKYIPYNILVKHKETCLKIMRMTYKSNTLNEIETILEEIIKTNKTVFVRELKKKLPQKLKSKNDHTPTI